MLKWNRVQLWTRVCPPLNSAAGDFTVLSAVARNTTANALTASAGTAYIPAHFYHWERERAERERHDRAGKERGRERREGEGLIRLVNEARERRSRDQNVRSRPKHIRSRRRPECLTYHATYMCKYISLSCCEINIRGRMHDADVSASLRLKLTYDGLAD